LLAVRFRLRVRAAGDDDFETMEAHRRGPGCRGEESETAADFELPDAEEWWNVSALLVAEDYAGKSGRGWEEGDTDTLYCDGTAEPVLA
jgi:hypothetical protein